jgi:ribonucleoside-diphosphate reductase alpha chain
VLEARYLIKDETGKCTEAPEQLFRRVARTVADAELLYDSDSTRRSEWEARFFDLMATGKFMPNSPTLMNAGREMACSARASSCRCETASTRFLTRSSTPR